MDEPIFFAGHEFTPQEYWEFAQQLLGGDDIEPVMLVDDGRGLPKPGDVFDLPVVIDRSLSMEDPERAQARQIAEGLDAVVEGIEPDADGVKRIILTDGE